MLDVVLTIINVILAVVSAFGACNSIKYFRKSKNLTIFAQTNKALVEVQKMLIKLPEALSASNSSRRGKKGLSFVHFIHDAVHILRGQLSAGKKLSKLECEMLGFYFALFSVGCCSAFNE